MWGDWRGAWRRGGKGWGLVAQGPGLCDWEGNEGGVGFGIAGAEEGASVRRNGEEWGGVGVGLRFSRETVRV